MTRAAPLAAALALALAGGCRSDAPRETWERRDPPGPLSSLVDWPVPGNYPAFARDWLGDGGIFWATLDLDGDGRPDLVRTGEDEARSCPFCEPSPWVFYRNTGRGFAGGTPWPVPAGGYAGRGFVTADFQTRGSVGPAELWRTVDVDGDRRPDLVVTGHRPDGTSVVRVGPWGPRWRVYRNQGDRFAVDADEWPLDADAANVAGGFVGVGPVVPADGQCRGQLFDLDGDGLADLVATTKDEGLYVPGTSQVPGLADREPHWRFLRNTGAGFAPATAWPVPDLNRGVPDYPLGGLHATAWNDSYTGGVAWTLADLDADGRPDLVVTSGPGVPEVPGLADGDPHWDVYRNTGAGFAPEPRPWPVPALVSRRGAVGPFAVGAESELFWSVLDFDGDGRPDLLETAAADGAWENAVPGFPADPTWTLYRNRGDGFDRAGEAIGVPDGGLDQAGFAGASRENGADAKTAALHAWRTTDVDGDGRADLVWILARKGVDPAPPRVMGLPDSPHWLVSFQRAP